MSPKDDEIRQVDDQLLPPSSRTSDWFGKHRKCILASVGAGLVLMLVLGLSLGLSFQYLKNETTTTDASTRSTTAPTRSTTGSG